MNKKEYIKEIKNLIISRVKYHAPMVQENDVDYALLNALEIDVQYPIFLYKKPLNKVYFDAFLAAKKECNFNLILTEKPLVSNKKLKELKHTILLFPDEIGINLSTLLNNLNVNYSAKSDYKISRNYEYLKVNNHEIIFDFIPFYKQKKLIFDGVIFDSKQFLLNGKNYAIDLANTRDKNNVINFELNIPLPQGYYKFKKNINNIEIKNLTNNDRAFFNFFIKNSQVNFSCIDGLSCSSFSCVNFRCRVELKPKEKKQLFFNFGEEKIVLNTPKTVQDYFSQSQMQMFEIFDTKITTRDQKIDNLFNCILPKKIWESWSNFSYDEISENRWVAMKGEIVKNGKHGLEISKHFPLLREVKLYRNHVWKRVFIVHGQSTYLFVGRVKYYNYTILSKEIFDKNNEIYLSFAS